MSKNKTYLGRVKMKNNRLTNSEVIELRSVVERCGLSVKLIRLKKYLIQIFNTVNHPER